MKLFCLFYLSVLIYSVAVMAMPRRASLTPLSSEDDFVAIRGANLQNIANIQEPYPIYEIAPVSTEDRQRPNLSFLRYLRAHELPYSLSTLFHYGMSIITKDNNYFKTFEIYSNDCINFVLINTLAYINNIHADSNVLRQLLLSKLLAQCAANQTKSQTSLFCKHLYDSASNLYFTVSPERQLSSESSKIKKNFDEIDKTSASFSTLNQLI